MIKQMFLPLLLFCSVTTVAQVYVPPADSLSGMKLVVAPIPFEYRFGQKDTCLLLLNQEETNGSQLDSFTCLTLQVTNVDVVLWERLTHVRHLSIIDTNYRGWTIYPPLSGLVPQASFAVGEEVQFDVPALDSLRVFACGQVNINTIPAGLAQAAFLEALYLPVNALKRLPRFLVKLPRLRYLNMSHNQHIKHSQAIRVLTKLSSLEQLHVINCGFSEKQINQLIKALPECEIMW